MPVEDLTDLRSENAGRIGLDQKGNPIFQYAAEDNYILGVVRSEQYLRFGADVAESVCRLTAVQAWHDDIAYQEVNRPLVFLRQHHSLFAVSGSQHPVAELRQDTVGQAKRFVDTHRSEYRR
jgi:gamma-glutamyl:cysteine ligase YbdK (ATP-grasp superfamily)